MHKPIKISQPDLVFDINAALTKQVPDMPFCPDIYNTVIKAANLIIEECAREPVKAEKGMSIGQWFNSDDTGLSSRYMAYVIDGGQTRLPVQRYEYPRDSGDFGRCVRMVEACGLEKKVFLMLTTGHEWRDIATNWEELVALYKSDEHERLYEKLKEARVHD